MTVDLSYQVFGAILLFLVLQPFVVKSKPLELESLQNLRARKGDTVSGLNQLKQYLKAFGYYPQGIKLLANDHFDESLESALKAFQENYNLKVTSKVDPDTIKAIKTPRCGVPDVIRNRTSNVIFHFVANYSFFSGYPRWSRYRLTYNFLNGVQLFSVQQLSPIIANAFQTWAKVSPFRFQQVPQGTRADIRIGFYRRNHGDGYPFDGPGNTLAHAFAPQDGRFRNDADENWSSNPRSYQIDLESVAVHEIGHILGLGHSQDRNTVMFPSY